MADAPADTRERILAVAQRRFVEVGYDATSLREIAEDLGVTKAALYYHFPSKLEILQALLQPLADVFGETLEVLAAVRTSDDPVEAWADALERIVRRMTEFRPLFVVIQRNRQVAEAMFAEGSDLFTAHAENHSAIDAVLVDLDVPDRDRVRMACALGAVTGFDDWAPGLLERLDEDTLVSELVAMTRDVLRLPPRPAEA